MSSWEWQYRSNPQRWTITRGEWNAVVQRIPGRGYHWRPRVEHITNMGLHYDGSITGNPIVARTWCLTKIAELQGMQNGKSDGVA